MVVEEPFGSFAIDEVTKMVRDLQIAQPKRNSGGPQVWQPAFLGRCMWYENPITKEENVMSSKRLYEEMWFTL